MLRYSMISLTTTAFLLGGCASLPDGPSVMALAGQGKSYEQFRGDDYVCQQYALMQVGGVTPNQAATQSGLSSAAAGTAVGAAAGAALGGGTGAAIGAGTGLVAGSAVGTGMASSSMSATQQRYDMTYIQCMYAKGHRVPVNGQFSTPQTPKPVSAPAANLPPPPAGMPPEPPSQ